MNELLNFANTVSPLGVIFLLVYVVIVLLRNSNIVGKIRGGQVVDRENVIQKTDSDVVSLNKISNKLDNLNNRLDKIADNHLHGLPEMKKSLERIEVEQNKQGNRLSSVETAIKFLAK